MAAGACVGVAIAPAVGAGLVGEAVATGACVGVASSPQARIDIVMTSVRNSVQ